MARVTVEDCVNKISNRFKLVLLATQRARELSSGALPTVARDNDKNPVIALREIAEGTVPVENLEQRFLRSLEGQNCGFTSQEKRDVELQQAMQNEGTSHLQDTNSTDLNLFSNFENNDELDEDDTPEINV